MYRVIQNNNIIGYSDTLRYITVSNSGVYIQTDKEKANGFCVKLPINRINEETGEIEHFIQDTPFVFPNKQLLGTEQTAEVEEISGALLIEEMQKTINSLKQ